MVSSARSESTVERREACPKCRSYGGDKSGDNVAVYSDGGKHCFANCGYHVFPTPWEKLKQAAAPRDPTMVVDDALQFPKDYTPLNDALWAKPGIAWLRTYGVSDAEITKYRIGWSANEQLLIFPVFETKDGQERLVMWQARNFGPGAKYLTHGEKRDIMHLTGRSDSGIVIATEDMVSAIKVGRNYQTLPLWGADMTLRLIRKLSERFDELGIWLDSDKTKEAVKLALRASQYIPTFVVASAFDPKHYGFEATRDRVEEARRQTLWKDGTEDRKKQAVQETGYPEREECERRLRNALAAAKKPVTGDVGVLLKPTSNIAVAEPVFSPVKYNDPNVDAFGREGFKDLWDESLQDFVPVTTKQVQIHQNYHDETEYTYRKDAGGS